jgi:hypothetical protein
MSTILHSIAAVREAISNKKPFCTGTYPLSENAGLLFFRRDERRRRRVRLFSFLSYFYFTYPWRCCQMDRPIQPHHTKTASPPRGMRPSLKDNDTHPKAWKLDNPNFSTRFDMLDAGIVEHVRSKLAKGGFVPLERVRAELRELNVHGE